MNNHLFDSLIQNLLHMNVTRLKAENCEAFSASYCRFPALQEIYSAERLLALSENAVPDTLYDLRDLFGINALAVKPENTLLFIGPFVSQEFMEPAFRSLLQENGYSASHLPALRLFYSEFPLQSRKTAADMVTGMLKSLLPTSVSFTIETVRCGKKTEAIRPAGHEEAVDYEPVYRRYEEENRFMRTIENGDTEHLLASFENMHTLEINSRRYVGAIYQEPAVALAILRTLARKAAEKGGASVVEIDEITQRAAQSMTSARSLYKAQEINVSMLLELTEAVRRSRENDAGLSAPIKKATEYLRLHFSEELSLSALADTVGLSPAYLSSLFKKETGETVTDHLTGLRTALAARLLRESTLPIQEISSFVGYPDNNYFIKVFRKKYGITPGEYRKTPK